MTPTPAHWWLDPTFEIEATEPARTLEQYVDELWFTPAGDLLAMPDDTRTP